MVALLKKASSSDVRTIVAALVLLLAIVTHAQDSQFLFDPNGNLILQTTEVSASPQILGQPQNQIVAPGESTSFSVVAADTRALSYQWRFNGANITGATADALLLQNVGATNEGQYRVVLTNPSGSITSAPAMLWLDSDGDGMGDSWEFTYFGNLNRTATSDFDGDGVSNLQEFVDGTNPTNNISARFRLTLLSDGGSVIKLPDLPSYTNGQSVTLTASPVEAFHAWTGDVVTRSNSITLTMTNDKTVFAHFGPVTFVWTKTTSGDWTIATNWTPNLVPGSNDTAIITSGVTVTLNVSADCANFTLGDAVNSPILTGTGGLTVHDTFTWISGSMSGSGRTVVETGATLNIPAPRGVGLDSRALENGGVLLWRGAGSIALNNGAVLTNRPGSLFLAGSDLTFGAGAHVGRVDNAGTFRNTVNGEAISVNSVSFNNYGAVELQSSSLTLAGGGTNTGTIVLSADTLLKLSGGTFICSATSTITGSGQLLVSGGTETFDGLVNVSGTNSFSNGTANFIGQYICTNNTLAISGGTVNFDGTSIVTPSTVVLGGGTLAGSNSVTVGSLMNWTGGSMSGSGRTLIAVGATLQLNVPNAGSIGLGGRTLENGGTFFWTGPGFLVMNSGAVITNRAGALFEFDNATGFGFFFPGNRVDNAGLLRKVGNVGTTTIPTGVSLNNYGTLEIQAGTLLCSSGFANYGAVNLSAGTTNRLAGGGAASGPFSVLATALMEWSGNNTFTLNSGSQLTGTGLYRISGGTVTGNTDLTVENLDLIGGALNGASTVTINTAMNWTSGGMSGSGRTIIPTGATLQLAIPGAGAMILDARTLENGGTFLWTGVNTLGMNNGAVVTNRAGALIELQNAPGLGFFTSGNRIDNAGLFRKSGAPGTTTFPTGVRLNNYGTMEIQTGTLLCSSGFTNTGVVNLSAGATNRLAGGGTATGPFNASATALVEWSAGTFTLSAGSQLNGAGLYRISGGTVFANTGLAVENVSLSGALDGTGTVTINSAMNWTAGSMSGSGRTVISAGSTLQLAPSSSVSVGRTLENGGAAVWTGAGNISMGGGVITNRVGALFNAQNAASLTIFAGFNRFENAGTFRKSVNTGTTTISGTINLNNYGTVEIQSGTLLCGGPFTNNGVVNLSAGTTNRLTGGGSASGPFNVPTTALMEWSGNTTFALNAGSQLSGSGLYRITGSLTTVTANPDLAVENLDLVAGTLNGGGILTISGSMNWTGGSMAGSGRTIIPAGVTLNLAVPSSAGLSRVLENGGTVIWTGAGNIGLGGGVITNRPGALFDAQNAASLTIFAGFNRFDNAGTFCKSVNTGTTTIGGSVPFTNYGMVDIRTGILAAGGGYTSTSNALLNCTLGGTNVGTGYGRLQVSGTAALNGALSVELTNGFVPSLNDSFTVLTAGTRTGTFASFSYPSNQVTMQLSNTPNSVVVSVIGLSSPRPTLLMPQISGSTVLLSWTAVSNGVYRLEFTPALDPVNWVALPGDVTSTGSIASKQDVLTSSNRFYRVRVIGQ